MGWWCQEMRMVVRSSRHPAYHHQRDGSNFHMILLLLWERGLL